MKIITKRGLFVLSLFAFVFIFSISASAEASVDEIYKRQYEISGADELENLIPKETKKYLNDIEISAENPDSVFNIKSENIFNLVMDFLVDGVKSPLNTALSIIGVLLIFASFDGIATLGMAGNNMTTFVCFIASMVATAPIFSLMDGVKTAVQAISNFMFGLVPVYTGVMLSMGNANSAGGFSALLLGASEVVSYLISYFFVPLSGAVLCLGICGGISPIPMISRIAGWIKKSAIWAMGIATTLFLSILSLQNSISSAADGLTMRTSKAMLSTTIPLMGPAIAETLNTAKGCMSMLKSSIGIYAVVAIIVLALPTIFQVVLWRFSMWVTAGVAEIFGMKQVENLLRSVDFCLSVLLSATCFITLLFIISLAMVTGSG